MAKNRRAIPATTETDILIASRRRCCLCVFLDHDDRVHKGQIAHLNRDPSDCRFKNLVWLCFNHHDEYDGSTSQAKGLTRQEVEVYRNKLYSRYNDHGSPTGSPELLRIEEEQDDEERIRAGYTKIRENAKNGMEYFAAPWRFPLWQVANRPELFAYKAGNRCDGVCLIERINLPDERVVIAAIQIPGNPGSSITNCVEELCHQVCERFAIDARRLVWLQHYDDDGDEWTRVTFKTIPPEGPFADPEWTIVDSEAWADLRLRPKKRLIRTRFEYESKLHKCFEWSHEAI